MADTPEHRKPPGFRVRGPLKGPVRVVQLEDGREVSRPDIAAKAVAEFHQATERAEGVLEFPRAEDETTGHTEPLAPVIPLFPEQTAGEGAPE